MPAEWIRWGAVIVIWHQQRNPEEIFGEIYVRVITGRGKSLTQVSFFLSPYKVSVLRGKVNQQERTWIHKQCRNRVYLIPQTGCDAIVDDLCYSYRIWNEGADGPFTSTSANIKCNDWGSGAHLAKIETSAQHAAVAEALYDGHCALIGAVKTAGVWSWRSDNSPATVWDASTTEYIRA